MSPSKPRLGLDRATQHRARYFLHDTSLLGLRMRMKITFALVSKKIVLLAKSLRKNLLMPEWTKCLPVRVN